MSALTFLNSRMASISRGGFWLNIAAPLNTLGSPDLVVCMGACVRSVTKIDRGSVHVGIAIFSFLFLKCTVSKCDVVSASFFS